MCSYCLGLLFECHKMVKKKITVRWWQVHPRIKFNLFAVNITISDCQLWSSDWFCCRVFIFVVIVVVPQMRSLLMDSLCRFKLKRKSKGRLCVSIMRVGEWTVNVECLKKDLKAFPILVFKVIGLLVAVAMMGSCVCMYGFQWRCTRKQDGKWRQIEVKKKKINSVWMC